MQVRSEPQMPEAAILVSAPQTAEAHHKAPAAMAPVDPQPAAWRRSAGALTQMARQIVMAELLNTAGHSMVPTDLLQRKGEAATQPQVVHRSGEAGMPRADL
jgi:hypothetical protein